MLDNDFSFFEEPEFLDTLHKYESLMEQGIHGYMDADELTDVAEYYMINGREEEANSCIEQALSLHPGAVDPLIFLARQAMFKGDFEESQRIIDGIIDQHDREVIFVRAELLIRQQKESAANAYLEAQLQEMSDERDLADFAFDCAGIFADYCQWDLTKQWLTQLDGYEPDADRTKQSWCDYYLRTGDGEEAERRLNSLIDEDAFNPRLWTMLSEAMAAQGKYEEALDSIENVLAIDDSDTQANEIKANCLFQLNRFDEAHALLNKLIEKLPESPVPFYLNGMCLSNLQRYDEALVMLRKAESLSNGLSPEEAGIKMQISFAESKLHHLDKAIKALDEAMMSIPPEKQNDLQVMRGHIYIENDHEAEGWQCFQQAITLSDDPDRTYMQLAIALAESDYFERAIAIFMSLLQRGKESMAEVSPYLAYCYYNLYNTAEYEKYYAIAIKQNPRITQMLFNQE